MTRAIAATNIKPAANQPRTFTRVPFTRFPIMVLLLSEIGVASTMIKVSFIDAAADSETSDRLHRKTNAFLPAWVL
jgi:hypothetical protein